MEKKGHDSNLIEEIASNASNRARIRNCLQSHTGKLRSKFEKDPTLKDEFRRPLIQKVQDLEQSATGRLDQMEQTVRELLQIVCSQVPISFLLTITLW
jgi:hypothetical protein